MALKTCFFLKFDISISENGESRLQDDVIPKTAQNFLEFATGEHSYGYENSYFHRAIPQFML